jgi:predicted RNA-binding protein with PUA-like domain
MAKPQYWLIKSEPSVYAYAQLQQDGETGWTGVRNFEARNNLREMKRNDLCLFYHSNEGKEIVGVARVIRDAYPDASAEGEDWSAVDVEPAYSLSEPVSLSTLKARKATASMELVTRSRLSVTKVTAAEWKAIHTLAKTKNVTVHQASKP